MPLKGSFFHSSFKSFKPHIDLTSKSLVTGLPGRTSLTVETVEKTAVVTPEVRVDLNLSNLFRAPETSISPAEALSGIINFRNLSPNKNLIKIVHPKFKSTHSLLTIQCNEESIFQYHELKFTQKIIPRLFDSLVLTCCCFYTADNADKQNFIVFKPQRLGEEKSLAPVNESMSQQ